MSKASILLDLVNSCDKTIYNRRISNQNKCGKCDLPIPKFEGSYPTVCPKCNKLLEFNCSLSENEKVWINWFTSKYPNVVLKEEFLKLFSDPSCSFKEVKENYSIVSNFEKSYLVLYKRIRKDLEIK